MEEQSENVYVSHRKSMRFAAFFATAALLLNCVSFFIAVLFTKYGEVVALSPEGVSAVLDFAIAAAFIFGLYPFNFMRFKVLSAAGFFAYCAYSAACGCDAACAAQIVMGVALGLLTVRFPPVWVCVFGALAIAASIYVDVNLYLN